MNKPIFNIVCKCCEKVLRKQVADFDGITNWAEKLSDRHLNWRPDVCEQRHQASSYLLPYDIIELTEEELKNISYENYMNGANL